MRQVVKSYFDEQILLSCKQKGIDLNQVKLDEKLNLVQFGVFNSLDFLDFIGTIEDHFEIEIDLSELSPMQMQNYSELLEVIVVQVNVRSSND